MPAPVRFSLRSFARPPSESGSCLCHAAVLPLEKEPCGVAEKARPKQQRAEQHKCVSSDRSSIGSPRGVLHPGASRLSRESGPSDVSSSSAPWRPPCYVYGLGCSGSTSAVGFRELFRSSSANRRRSQPIETTRSFPYMFLSTE